MSIVRIYGVPLSAPTRILTMTCEVLGVQYEMIPTNPLYQETRTPEFLELNPQHTIPLLVDGDFKINESRAAAAYLVNKYGWTDCQLYPSEPTLRGVIDQRLYFDIGTFYRAFYDCYSPMFFEGADKPSEKSLNRLHEVLGWVRDFIAPTGFVAGTNELTLADISFLATFHTLLACDFVNLDQYNPELKDWCRKCRDLIPNYDDANRKGAIEFGELYKSKAS